MPPGELARLYDTHAPALWGFLLNFTRDPADSRDALQEVFLRLSRRPNLLDGVADERAFLLRLAHNLAVDLIRRQSARRQAHAAFGASRLGLFVPAPDPDQAAAQGEIEAALGDLPPEQRAVVQLKLWEGLTFQALAEVLGIPPNTAASRYRYALDKLRARLRPLYAEWRQPGGGSHGS